MYGLINRAIEDMTIAAGGKELWETICKKAELSDVQFQSLKTYPDEITYKLVSAASEVMEKPAEDILYAFGQHWILFSAKEGYGQLMAVFGNDMKDFLQNLNKMHAQLAASMPVLEPPTFKVKELEAGDLEVEYHSDRPGLANFVAGLLDGLGEMYNVAVGVNHIQEKDEDKCDIFRVSFL